jgi:hypothetical protein
MITFKCTKTECPNANIDYNFLGNPETAECGGCKTTLVGFDERTDPEVRAINLNVETTQE